ncbi:MAG: helix-turn-helix domain-containing protein [Candidatus Moraniibacteriota bacterium]|jgi:IS30 family transposase
MSHKHITSSQRNELSALIRAGSSQKQIAKLLKKDRTTIWRERKRVKLKNGKYHAKKAKEDAKAKQIQAHKRKRKIENSPWLKKFIEKKIGKRWSPDQISGRLKEKYPNDKSKHVGKDTIYKCLYTHRKDMEIDFCIECLEHPALLNTKTIEAPLRRRDCYEDIVECSMLAVKKFLNGEITYSIWRKKSE